MWFFSPSCEIIHPVGGLCQGETGVPGDLPFSSCELPPPLTGASGVIGQVAPLIFRCQKITTEPGVGFARCRIDMINYRVEVRHILSKKGGNYVD